MSNNKVDSEKWEEASKVFIEAMKEIEDEQESWWNSLSKDDQIKAFCCISRRIYQGEIVEHRSYRGMLYSIMGFGPEAYVQAQDAGYLEIHNSIYTGTKEFERLTEEEIVILSLLDRNTNGALSPLSFANSIMDKLDKRNSGLIYTGG